MSFTLLEQARKENTHTNACSISSTANYVGSTIKGQLDAAKELLIDFFFYIALHRLV